jgi:hypothetical protein
MFREYTPLQGRWMSPDPYSGSYDTGNPQSFNRYSYVLNNPINMTDPLGLDTTCVNGVVKDSNGTVIGGSSGSCKSKDDDDGPVWYDPFSWFSGWGGPSFHGSLKPRPNASNNVQQQTQQCIRQFYNSPAGKAVQFGSPLSLLPGWNSTWASNLGEWAVAIVGKGGGTFGAGIYTGTEQVVTINGTTSVASTLETKTHAFLGGLGKLATAGTIAATGIDAIAHAGCATGARQNAGQMTPLPPGVEVSF